MSMVLKCDVCRHDIGNADGVNVFRMWNLGRAGIVLGRSMDELVYDEDWHLCDGCYGRLWEIIEREAGRGSE